MKTEFIEVSPETGLAIGLAMVIAGILFLGWKAKRISIEYHSLAWTQTSGMIQSSNFYETRSSTKESFIYHGEFTYQYLVQNHEYIGTRYDVTGDMHTGLESESQEFEDRIHSNSEVNVFYDPNEPSSSLLKNGFSEDSSVRLVFSMFLIIVGSIVLWYQWRRYRTARLGRESMP